MLSALYITLRFVHFAALMVLLGSTVCSVLLAPQPFKPVLSLRLAKQWRPAIWLSLISAILLLGAQAGLMGSGWADTVNPQVWFAVLGTRFGSVWLWQISLGVITVVVFLLKPRALQSVLLILAAAQLILLAGVGHAAMREGLPGGIQRLNHAIHLLSAAWWAGGLLPLLMCMRMAHKPRWRHAAITAMMRFSRYGHLAVAAVIVTGVVNSLMILGWSLPLESRYVQLLLLKVALVAVMVTIALFNRYVLVPRFTGAATPAQQRFIQLTWLEVVLSVAVLLAVSAFATWEPF
ncbi:copper homeostasis membrane protein CopD [Enterobacteriaceae bacterium H20N1]|uniref:Copper resistance protein D n=1 Tax=Dryocola boscaweniae TaxID=2925397 RepID=A0A9X2W7N5_9ENTR|nr:copper homeostasis membrane protein CopD [Dryocola boscaweniae]MCT4702280.1 copper homeostasis membrane protein CopD [Dryocola boscaweniae]MCT4714335.1 copper homeostasis membrane protein CopD [Dryocola boscaweniae]MCT4719276.1 copper homeostasis membrane protein CopD [Dryocola boscaweniae]